MACQILPAFVLLFSLLLSAALSGAESEAEALLRWKSSMLDHKNLTSWSITAANTTVSPCKWYGITCNSNGSVVQLSLSSSNLNGTLDRFNFSSLSNLNVLYLGSNNLYGSLPESISVLSKLTELDLSWNNFSSSIPPQYGQLQELLYLNLYYNKLSGEIPYRLTRLQNRLQKLQHLDLGWNYYLQNPSNLSWTEWWRQIREGSGRIDLISL